MVLKIRRKKWFTLLETCVTSWNEHKITKCWLLKQSQQHTCQIVEIAQRTCFTKVLLQFSFLLQLSTKNRLHKIYQPMAYWQIILLLNIIVLLTDDDIINDQTFKRMKIAWWEFYLKRRDVKQDTAKSNNKSHATIEESQIRKYCMVTFRLLWWLQWQWKLFKCKIIIKSVKECSIIHFIRKQNDSDSEQFYIFSQAALQ